MHEIRSVPRSLYQLFNTQHIRDINAERGLYPVMLAHYYGITTSSDGHCLFRALSFCLFGDQHRHLSLRLASIHIFIQQFNYFSQVYHRLGGDQSDNFKVLVRQTAFTGPKAPIAHWGDGNHLKALCIASRRHLHVFRPIPHAEIFAGLDHGTVQARINEAPFGTQGGSYTPFQMTPDAQPLCVMFVGGNHYVPLLPRHRISTTDFTLLHKRDVHQIAGLPDYEPVAPHPDGSLVVIEDDH